MVFEAWEDYKKSRERDAAEREAMQVFERAVLNEMDGDPFMFSDEDDGGVKRPLTGKFLVHEAWHDPYQKRVLGTEFDSQRPAIEDGSRVLDLVAAPAEYHRLSQEAVDFSRSALSWQTIGDQIEAAVRALYALGPRKRSERAA